MSNKDSMTLTKEDRIKAYEAIFYDDEEYIDSFLVDKEDTQKNINPRRT